MDNALKELFNAYKNLPVGVIFFKNKQLFFVNDHLRNILLLGNLASDDVIQIIGGMLGIDTPSHPSLHAYLSDNDFFWYRDRIVQIEHREYEEITIFVLIRLNDKSIEAVDAARSLRLMREKTNPNSVNLHSQDIHTLFKQTLGTYEGVQIPSIVLYKGIPIKGSALIRTIEQDDITIEVEKKQLIAAQNGAQWLLGFKRERMISAVVKHYDLLKCSISLGDLHSISRGFHQRNLIRYHANDQDVMAFSVKGKRYRVPIRDLSERGIAVQTDDSETLIALSALAGKMIDAQITLGSHQIMVTLTWLYTVALNEEGAMMKAAFQISYDTHNGMLLQECLNTQQLHLIKEVRSFVQMLPPPPTEEAGDGWVI